MRTTSEIAERFGLEATGGSAEVSAVAIGTQHIVPGSLFIAVQGKNVHGLDFLEQAIQKGAVAVLSDRKSDTELPTLFHPNPREIAGAISDFVYGTTDSNMELFGVTGTNGKTSTVFYLNELLRALDVRAGMISSALIRVQGMTFGTELTTPEAPRIHQLLEQMRLAGESSCAIEVSAQGLSRKRTIGLRFRVSGFTNLSRDHLDDYPSMAQYLGAKAQLFSPEYSDLAVVLLEDEYAKELYQKIQIPKVGIGIDYEYRYEDQELELTGKSDLKASISIPKLMAKNLVLALVMLLEAGYKPKDLERAISKIETEVPGRLQKIAGSKVDVFVDYAHTPAAILATARELASQYKNLTVLLAASGDRDQGKRPAMAQAAAQFANQIVVTDQHPRSEDPATIRSQLLAALGDFEAALEIPDPAAAIAKAVEITAAGGAILWCGPGHLKYREVMGQKLPFDAVAISREVLDRD